MNARKDKGLRNITEKDHPRDCYAPDRSAATWTDSLEEAMLQTLRYALEDQGFEVMAAAANGLEALKAHLLQLDVAGLAWSLS